MKMSSNQTPAFSFLPAPPPHPKSDRWKEENIQLTEINFYPSVEGG